MSVRQMALVWARSHQTGSSLLLLLAIADFADDDGRAWPSVERLAQKSRLGVRQTQFLIRRLQEASELRIYADEGVVSTAGGIQRTNLYQLLVEGVQKSAPPSTAGQGGAVQRPKGVQASAPYTSVDPSGSSVVTTPTKSNDKKDKPLPSGEVILTEGGFQLPDGLLNRWREMFSTVDVPAMLKFIKEYADARPIWKRQRMSWRRTILNWLKREHERNVAKTIPRPAPRMKSMEDRRQEILSNIKGGGGGT